MAEHIYGFADTTIKEYPPFDFPSNLWVILGKSIKDPHSDSRLYASKELKSGLNYNVLHFTSILLLLPAPLAVFDSEGLAFKPWNLTIL